MKQIGTRGAVRGKVVKTTVPDTSTPCPRDKVNRNRAIGTACVS